MTARTRQAFPGRTSNHDTPPAPAAPPQEPAAKGGRIENRILDLLPDASSNVWPTQAEIARTLGEPVTLIDSMVYWLYQRGRVVHDGCWPHRWARAENGGER